MRARSPYRAKGLPWIGTLLALRRDPLTTLLRLSREHPGLVQLRNRWFLVSSPNDIQRVLAGPVRYTKGVFSESMSRTMVDPLGEALGDGLLTSEGQLWKRQRRLAQPAFLKPRIRAHMPAMLDASQCLVERWSNLPHDATVDVVEEMRRVALDTMARAVFSLPIEESSDGLGAALIEAVVLANEQFWSILPNPAWLPTPHNLRWKRLMRAVDSGVRHRIDQRRDHPTLYADVLCDYMQARSTQTGEGMSDALLRDEVMTLMIAGHDSTAQALCWTLYLLARHPDAQNRLRRELHEVLDGGALCAEHLPLLRYTSRVLHEAMRLYPPAWLLVRSPTQEDVVDGCTIPARSIVLISPYATHRRPDLWEDPERFDPDRFTAENSKTRPNYAYFPFGGGARQCIGNTFAIQTMLVVVARVLSRFELTLVPSQQVEPEAALTVRPKGGIRLRIHSQPPLDDITGGEVREHR